MINQTIDLPESGSLADHALLAESLPESFPFASNKANAWLQALMQSSSDAIVILDGQRRIVLASPETERVFGYSALHVTGRTVDILLSPASRERHLALLERYYAASRGGRKPPSSRLWMEGLRCNGEAVRLHATLARICCGDEVYHLMQLREARPARRTERIAVPGAAIPRSPRRTRAVSSQQASEVEKRRVSRELYDGLGQRLSVLKLDMAWIERELLAPASPVTRRLTQMQSLLDDIIAHTKKIASDLRPPLLDDFGLLAAVHWLANNFTKTTGIGCKLESSGFPGTADEPTESALYRVVQESLLNVERHACASQVRITLTNGENYLDVIVEDNGIGLPSGSENKNGCFGLVAMQERVYTLGGTISIHNLEPTGVIIHASIPVDSSAHKTAAS